jgi:hypothetical protein
MKDGRESDGSYNDAHLRRLTTTGSGGLELRAGQPEVQKQSIERQRDHGSGNEAGEATGEHAHGHGSRRDGTRLSSAQQHGCVRVVRLLEAAESSRPQPSGLASDRHRAPQARCIQSCAAARRRCCSSRLPSVHPAHLHQMESIRPAFATLRLSAPRRAPRPLYRCLHTSVALRATPLPHPSVPGPPPETPTPAPSDALYRVARKRKQAELLKQAREVRTTSSSKKTLLQKRFWKDVSVKETGGDCPASHLHPERH